jgi:hypothetical protein
MSVEKIDLIYTWDPSFASYSSLFLFGSSNHAFTYVHSINTVPIFDKTTSITIETTMRFTTRKYICMAHAVKRHY